MDEFIPKEKRSKKEQKKLNARSRVLWTRNPTTRIKESGKRYDRNKMKHSARKEEL